MTFRRFLLSSSDAGPQVIRLLAGVASLPSEGKSTSWVTVTRTGSFTDPRYGRFEITRDMLLSMVRNFDTGTVGTDIFLDVNHKPGDGAAAKVLRLSVEGERLRALVEWTEFGREAVQKRGFRYLSAEFTENYQDNEAGKLHGPVLLGAGLTVRPVIKRLDPVTLSCDSGADSPVLIHPELAQTLLAEAEANMNKLLKALLERLAAKQLSQTVIDTVKTLGEQTLPLAADEAGQQQIVGQLETHAVTLSEAMTSAAGGAAPTIQLSMTTAGNVDVAAEVTRILAERANSARQLAEATDSRRKLLSDTIHAAAGLDDALKKVLSESVAKLVDGSWSEDQVRVLAQSQIEAGNREVAARQLAQLGYQPHGTPRIAVVDEGVRQLSELYRDMLGRTSMAGKLHLDTKAPQHPFVALVLSEFDRLHGAQLENERKILLAQGNTAMADTALPVGFQREVIREALSDLRVLELVNTLTDFGAQATTQIPFETRDMSQIVNDGIVYEGQPIPTAGVVQSMELAYVTPMKLALSVTNEVAHFTRTSGLNWDAMARNIESNARILRELVHRRICNELQRASDAYLSVAVTAESFTAQLTGAKHTIKTAFFPIVRPFQPRDMAGTAVGIAENTLTVTLNSSAVQPYNGTNKQNAGTYYRVLSYNLGLIQFVNQLGVPVMPPTNAATNTISYSRATNISLFDMDPTGGLTQEQWLNGLVQKIGTAKAVMNSQRYSQPDFMLMSSTLNDTISNAEQFISTRKRDGSNTSNSGDLEEIKGLPGYSTNSPGIDLGDERVLMGSRGLAAYTIVKPFVTGEPVEMLDSSTGRPVGRKTAYGEEYNAIVVPRALRGRFTSVIAYSATARAAI